MASLLLATAALLINPAHHILLCQRPAGKPYAGYWEFPGGKIEAGESPEMALCRELEEELAITTTPEHLQPFTFLSHRYPEWHVLVPLFTCRSWKGCPTPQENQQIAWVTYQTLQDYALLPSNSTLYPAIQQLLHPTV